MTAEPVLWSRTDSFVSTELEDGLVILNLEHGRYFSFGGTGPAIWDLLATPRSSIEIAETLTAEFDISPEECAREVDRFLAALLEKDLVRQVEPPAAT